MIVRICRMFFMWRKYSNNSSQHCVHKWSEERHENCQKSDNPINPIRSTAFLLVRNILKLNFQIENPNIDPESTSQNNERKYKRKENSFESLQKAKI